MEQFVRSQLLLGAEAMEQLQTKTVAVFGIGGVGGHAVEALARSGIGKLVLVDSDTVSITNLNRQIIATMDTIGRYKTDVMRERILSINPNAEVTVYHCFFLPETADGFSFSEFDYIVDAVDTVTAKLELVSKAEQHHVPIISCMGAGNKLDPTAFEVSDISETSVCPLAKVMRKELKKRGITRLKVVYSKEKTHEPRDKELCARLVGENPTKRSIPGSVSFVPSVAGLIMAGEVIKELSGVK